jgi:hypothetical protein
MVGEYCKCRRNNQGVLQMPITNRSAPYPDCCEQIVCPKSGQDTVGEYGKCQEKQSVRFVNALGKQSVSILEMSTKKSVSNVNVPGTIGEFCKCPFSDCFDQIVCPKSDQETVGEYWKCPGNNWGVLQMPIP